MISVANQTESLLRDTKALLKCDGRPSLRQISASAGVEFEWLRKFAYTEIQRPDISRVEAVYRYLSQWQAAKLFQKEEARAAG